MRLLAQWVCLFGILGAVTIAQQEATVEEEPKKAEPRTPPQVIAEMQEPIRIPARPVLVAGTQVWLRLNSEVQVKKVKVGQEVDFLLYHDLYYRDYLLAREGTAVQAHVEMVQKAKLANRGSKLRIVFTGLKLTNGQTVPLSGESTAQGGAGLGGGIASSLLDVMSQCSGWPCILFDVPAAPTALVLGLGTKGKNQNVRVDASAPAFVDRDTEIDLSGLEQVAQSPAAKGNVTIVRGEFGAVLSRDLYCNGVPIAHMEPKRKLELQLKPGFYRLAIYPKKGAMEVFVNSDSDIRLITDSEHVYELRERNDTINTRKVLGKRNEGQFFMEAKPVEKTDIYTTECAPLAEEVEEEQDVVR